MVAANVAGGDHRGPLAAGIRGCKPGIEKYCLEFYPGKSGEAVTDLTRKYAELKHEAKGE